MHLLDIPKPNRSRHLPNMRLLVITGLVFGLLGGWLYYGEVSTCRLTRSTHPATWQYPIPLRELYDELEQRDRERNGEVGLCGNSLWKERDEILLPVTKAFAKKYGLTLKQVKLIRHDGYWLKNSAHYTMTPEMVAIIKQDREHIEKETEKQP